MIRTGEQIDEEKRAGEQHDAAVEALARRQTGARRTAWIIGAIAVAFFIASLVQGHLVHIPH
jgi:hypothetical protein